MECPKCATKFLGEKCPKCGFSLEEELKAIEPMEEDETPLEERLQKRMAEAEQEEALVEEQERAISRDEAAQEKEVPAVAQAEPVTIVVEEPEEKESELSSILAKIRLKKATEAPTPEQKPAQKEPEKPAPKPKETERPHYRDRYVSRMQGLFDRKKPEETDLTKESFDYTPSELGEPIKPDDLLPELNEETSSSKEITLESLAGLEQKEEKDACKTCGATEGEKYYCPFCGKEFCTACVPSKEDGPYKKYKCPNCGKEVVVAKEE